MFPLKALKTTYNLRLKSTEADNKGKVHGLLKRNKDK